MLKRSKTPLAIGLSCVASAALAGGAMAHGGGGGGDHGSRAGVELEVRGLVTELTAATPAVAATATTPAVPASAGTITVSPGGTLDSWTCTLREGADTSGIVVQQSLVKLKCRTRGGVLVAKRVRTTDDSTGKVKVEATGLVTAFTAAGASTTTPTTPAIPATPATPAAAQQERSGAPGSSTTPADPAVPAMPGTTTDGTPGSITVNPGTGLPTVTCAVTSRTRVRTAPVAGTDTASVTCRSFDDALVAKKIRVKGAKQGGTFGSRGGAGGESHRGGHR